MEEYWPKLDQTVEYSSVQIHHRKSEIFSNYVYRTLIVMKNNERRKVSTLE